MSFNEAEAQLVDAVKYGHLSMRIDHRNGTLAFGGQQLEGERVRAHLQSLASRLAKVCVPVDLERAARWAAWVPARAAATCLQPAASCGLPAASARKLLKPASMLFIHNTSAHSCPPQACAMIDPRPATGRAEEARRAAISLCRNHMESEHKRLLARKLLIEKRKEQQEQALLEAEREEERKRQQVRVCVGGAVCVWGAAAACTARRFAGRAGAGVA